MKEIKKIEFTSQEQIGYLSGYIKQILTALAEICSCPGMAEAYVSDKSALDHFLIILKKEEEPAAIEKLKDLLMIELDGTEQLVTIARRMAGLE